MKLWHFEDNTSILFIFLPHLNDHIFVSINPWATSECKALKHPLTTSEKPTAHLLLERIYWPKQSIKSACFSGTENEHCFILRDILPKWIHIYLLYNYCSERVFSSQTLHLCSVATSVVLTVNQSPHFKKRVILKVVHGGSGQSHLWFSRDYTFPLNYVMLCYLLYKWDKWWFLNLVKCALRGHGKATSWGP